MDDDFNYISLAALTANVVRWLELREHHQRDGQGNAGSQREDEDDAEQHVDGVQQSLKEKPPT